VLPKGVVCDKCNNYFAKAVEKPFLEDQAVRLLRFHECLPSKKGRVPPIAGVLSPGIQVEMFRNAKSGTLLMDVPPGSLDGILRQAEGQLILPIGGAPPAGPTSSRFFAKVAVESMAARLLHDTALMDQFIDDPQLDPIRNHARRGQTTDWSVHMRRIYGSNARTIGPDGESCQVMHESDFLMTQIGEFYCVQAIFGMEFTINIGGPSVDGYEDWLLANNGASPLYAPKNLGSYAMPIDREHRS
jgi:hypothetical protein